MTKYTKEDFEKSEFAKHPDGGIAIRYPAMDDEYPWHIAGKTTRPSDAGMALYGWTPVHTAEPVARSGKYEDLADRINSEVRGTGRKGTGLFPQSGSDFDRDRRAILRWLDEHPESAPKPTITESELRRLIDKHLPDGTTEEQVLMLMIELAITVVPDPEPEPDPEDVQRLAEVLSRAAEATWSEWGDLAKSAMRLGVKAPEGGDGR